MDSKHIKIAINNAKYLIENNDFQKFFDESLMLNRVDLAEFLYFNCHINFLEYMEEIPEYLFATSELLENIIIPDSIHTINSHAFYKCSNLKSITIPNSVIGFYDHILEIPCATVIRCYKGSPAHKWANKLNLKIEFINN